MAEENRVQVKMFGLLHTLRKREGKDTVASVEVPAEGVRAGQLAENLGLPVDKIEGVFCDHKAHGLDLWIKPGASIAFVPSGTPGPHRYTLGLYHAGKESEPSKAAEPTPSTRGEPGGEDYPRELAAGLWLLGDRYTNVLLAKGASASVLIEAGISAAVDRVLRQLEDLQAAPATIVVTHPHGDHLTGLPGLRERFPVATVVAGQGATEFAEHPRAAAGMLVEDRHVAEFYAAADLAPGRPPLVEPPSLAGCRIARDGERFDLGGLTVQLLAVAGHAPGQLAAWLPEIRALVVSDALGFHFPERGFLPVFFTSYTGYLATLDRLEALEPEIVCPAHLGPLVGDAARSIFRQAREAAQRFVARVRDNERRLEDFAEELFREVYVDGFLMYTEANIRTVVAVLIKRSLEVER